MPSPCTSKVRAHAVLISTCFADVALSLGFTLVLSALKPHIQAAFAARARSVA
jgi:hypothetical protein